jgi:chromosome segregation protein
MARLAALRLKGFKTFARPTELIFDSGIAVVIGPNGSGKSNLADAVLWALGEQSPTSIRGRSMQDFIFSGSDGRRSAAAAEVTLVFDNSAGLLPVPYSEVEITRWVDRQGGSGYRMNGSACRLTDVHELVAAVGLGREMHSVISQGRVEEFLSSTPQTRRALVEEAAGLGRYKKRRQRSQSKLEKVAENLLRVRDVEAEIRKVIRPLKQQMAAAERHAQATEELAAAQARLLIFETVQLRGRQEEAETRLAGLRERKQQAEKELTEVREARTREEELFAGSLREREELAACYHRLEGELERLESRRGALGQRLSRLEAERARAERRLEAAAAERAAAETRTAEGEETSSTASRLGLVERALGAVGEAEAALRPRLQELFADVDELKDRIFDLESARTRAQQEREFLRRESDERSNRAEATARRREARDAELASLQSELLTLEESLSAAERGAAEAETAAAGAREGLVRVQNAATEAVRRESELRSAEHAAVSRRQRLEAMIARPDGQPEQVKRLLESRPGARLLTDCLAVAPGYERAVAAALGPLAQAVCLPGRPESSILQQVEGVCEVLWLGGVAAEPGGEAADNVVPGGAGDLFGVLDGPPPVLAALRKVLRPTLLVGDLSAPAEERAGGGARSCANDHFAEAPGKLPLRLLTPGGELSDSPEHAARRGEPGAEALFLAKSELGGLERELEHIGQALTSASTQTEAARQEEAQARQLLAEAEQEGREATRSAASLADEKALFARRLEQAREAARQAELREKEDRAAAALLESQIQALDMAQLEGTGLLDETRSRLKAVREEAQRLRERLLAVEQKRAQATLLQARLKERQRLEREEHARARARLAAAVRAAEEAARRIEVLDRLLPAAAELAAVMAGLVDELRPHAALLAARLAESRRSAEGFGTVLREHGTREAELQQALSTVGEELVEVQVSQAHLEERAGEHQRALADLRRRHLSPRQIDEAAVKAVALDALRAAVESAERRRERIGPVNPLAEQEYREASERAEFLAEQRRDLEESLRELKEVVRDLDRHIEDTFAEVFESTRAHFEDMVAHLFPGGRGFLRLVEPQEDEPGEEAPEEDFAEQPLARGGRAVPGIALEIKPPRKAPRSMSLLSGGEKALSAIAFLFALFLARPCPFYILDEVEAALDDVNIGRFLSLVTRYQEHAQFIIITHQRRTMEIADSLYGVAMDTDGTSRVLSRRIERAGEPAPPA